MLKFRCLPFLLLLLLLVSCQQAAPISSAEAPEEEVTFPTPYLLSAETVAQKLASANPPVILEISKPENFAGGHLPGALNLWRPDYEDHEQYPYGGMRASREKMAELLGKLGVKNDDLVVVYCTKGSADAARFRWILRGYGHQNVALMDGGKAGWQHAGYALTQEVAATRPLTDYRFSEPERPYYTASRQEVVAAIDDTSILIVDAREDYEYLGIPHLSNHQVVHFKEGAFAAGAIPSARHLNWSESVDLHTNHTFKSLTDLTYNFQREGITPDKEIIVYCQSGVRSAHTAFVLKELLGYPHVKNYDGSWIEWSYFYARDTTGKLHHHVSPAEREAIYRDLVASLGDSLND